MNTPRLIVLPLAMITLLSGCATVDPYQRLREAIHSRAPEQAQALLRTHPNQISATDAMIVAAQEGDTTAVDVFLGQGAAINQRNAEGETALALAAQQRDPHMVEHLVQRGADLTQRDGAGSTALDYIRKWAPQDTALSDQKELIALYLDTMGKGKSTMMIDVVQTLAQIHRRNSESTSQSEERVRVVDLHSSIIR